MAIRLVHQPVGIGGLAAYAAGRGFAEQRRRRYATDILRSQQARRDRYNLLRQQQVFQLGRDKERARQALIADVRGHNFRRNEIQLREQFDVEREERLFKREDEREDRLTTRRRAEADVGSLQIPPWVSPADRVELEKKRAAARGFLRHDIDFEDDDVRSKFSSALDNFNSYLGGLKPPNPADSARAEQFYRDPVTGEPFSEYAQGRIPYDSSGPIDLSQQKSFAEKYNERAAIREKTMNNRAGELGLDMNDLTPKQQKELDDFADKAGATLPTPPWIQQMPVTNPEMDVRGGTQAYGGGSQGRPEAQQPNVERDPQTGYPVLRDPNNPNGPPLPPPVKVNNDAEYDAFVNNPAIPSGTPYVAPDGTLRRKQ